MSMASHSKPADPNISTIETCGIVSHEPMDNSWFVSFLLDS